MQLKRIAHNDLDFKKWDHTILNSPFPFVFAQSFYLNATSPGWDALIVGDYESVFPLTIKTKFGYTYLPQPPFTSQLGLYGKVTPQLEEQVFAYLCNEFKLIEIELNAANTLSNGFTREKNTFIIQYDRGYKLNQNSKRNVNSATESGLKVERVSNDEILPLSKQYLNPFLSSFLKIKQKDIVLFDSLITHALKEGYLHTFKVVNPSGDLKAIGHFICNGKHALFLKGTNFDRAENSGSMHLLMNFAVEYFKDKSQLFDFGGGSNSEGLANFYKGLGGEKFCYTYLRVNNLPAIIKLLGNKR